MTSAWMPPLLGANFDDAAIWNKALAFSGVPIAIGASGAELTFLPIAAPTGNTPVAIVGLRGFKQPLLVSVREFPFEELCGVKLSLQDLDLLPSGLRDALYEGMIFHICDLVSPQSQGRWHLKNTHSLEMLPDQPANNTQWFEIVIAQGGASGFRIEVGISISDAARFVGKNPMRSKPSPSHFFQGIGAAADFTIGAITVTRREFGTLEPGSVVIMARRESIQT